MRILLPIVIVVVVLGAQYFRQRTMAPRVQYRCQSCGQTFSLSPLIATLAPHRMGSKFVKCPHCGARTWAAREPR